MKPLSHTALLATVAIALCPASAGAAKERVLYNFKGGDADGAGATSPLTIDASGSFYGTTRSGGGTGCGCSGCGTIFKLAPDGTESLLHIFSEGADGQVPAHGLTLDSGGNLYGATFAGGAYGAGTVFKLTTTGKEKILYSFTGGTDGATPGGNLLSDNNGNFWGTARTGGIAGKGTVFRITSRGKLTTLYSFTGGSDGAAPTSDLFRDFAGNLYGTTTNGGIDCGDDTGPGCGTVFELTASGSETVLYAFKGLSEKDGSRPRGGVIMDESETLYGTTEFGGDADCDCGVVFRLNLQHKERVLHVFTGLDGAGPQTGLTFGAGGIFYRTTGDGGMYAGGVVFSLSPKGKEKIVHAFGAGTDGYGITAPVKLDASGNLFGTVYAGGTYGDGIIFEIPTKKTTDAGQ